MNPGTQLQDETREMLNQRPASLKIRTIAKDIEVSPAWLHMFSRNGYPNPGIVTVGKLNLYLKEALKKVGN